MMKLPRRPEQEVGLAGCALESQFGVAAGNEGAPEFQGRQGGGGLGAGSNNPNDRGTHLPAQERWRDYKLRMGGRSPMSRSAMRRSAGRSTAGPGPIFGPDLRRKTCARLFWVCCSQSAFQISAQPTPATDAAQVAARRRRGRVSSMAGAPAPACETNVPPEPGRVGHAEKAMRGAVATRRVSSAEGRRPKGDVDPGAGCT
jgi:hypothetical protein